MLDHRTRELYPEAACMKKIIAVGNMSVGIKPADGHGEGKITAYRNTTIFSNTPDKYKTQTAR